ncbi:MAG: hypothetical protein ACOC3B_03160 [Bacillota bacterium]
MSSKKENTYQRTSDQQYLNLVRMKIQGLEVIEREKKIIEENKKRQFSLRLKYYALIALINIPFLLSIAGLFPLDSGLVYIWAPLNLFFATLYENNIILKGEINGNKNK